MSYQLTANGVIDLTTGASIPSAPDNDDWKIYQAWLAAGGVPVPLSIVPWSAEPTLTKMREAREIVLNRLMGIATAALIANDSATAAACASGRQQLLDITSKPSVVAATNQTELETALVYEYQIILSTMPANLFTAFEAFTSFNV